MSYLVSGPTSNLINQKKKKVKIVKIASETFKQIQTFHFFFFFFFFNEDKFIGKTIMGTLQPSNYKNVMLKLQAALILRLIHYQEKAYIISVNLTKLFAYIRSRGSLHKSI